MKKSIACALMSFGLAVVGCSSESGPEKKDNLTGNAEVNAEMARHDLAASGDSFEAGGVTVTPLASSEPGTHAFFARRTDRPGVERLTVVTNGTLVSDVRSDASFWSAWDQSAPATIVGNEHRDVQPGAVAPKQVQDPAGFHACQVQCGIEQNGIPFSGWICSSYCDWYF